MLNILFFNSPIYEYLAATLIEGLNTLGHNVQCTEASNYGTKIPEARIAAFSEHADLIVLGSGVGVRYDLARSLANPRKVFVDGNDSPVLGLPEGFEFPLIFKRELNRCDGLSAERRLHPLPFAAERRYFPETEIGKDLLVSFIANMHTNPMRYSVHQRLLNMKSTAIVSGTTAERAYDPRSPQPLPMHTPAYRTFLQRSLISVNVAGAGYDCARFWEILAARAMLFTYELDIQIPHGFTDGVDCVTFSSLREFEEKLAHYLNRLDLVREIAERGYQHMLRFHTTKARAEYFLSVAGRYFGLGG